MQKKEGELVGRQPAKQNVTVYSIPLKKCVCVHAHVNETHGLYISSEHTQRHPNHTPPHKKEKFGPLDYCHSCRGHDFANLTLVQEISVWVKAFLFKSIYF